MLTSVKYVCPSSGNMVTSSNIDLKIDTGYDLHVQGTEIKGIVTINVYYEVTCSCGLIHEMIAKFKNEEI